jgi:N-acetylneuraminic acid mutarotase
MRAARSDAVATRLNDGRILVVGGYGPTRDTGAEIYDPVTGAWSATGPMHAVRATPAVARLQDGRVLVAGGWEGSSSYLASAEIYDPGTDTWTETAPLGEARVGPSAATLPDGRVLVAGGYGYVLSPKVYPFASRTAELYDPASATWTRTGDLLTPRGEGSVMVNPSGGRPVMVGGFWWTNVDPVAGTWSTDSYERTIETYDAKAGSWASGPRLAHGRAGHVAVVLDHNAILVAGGFGSGMDAELLADPTPTPTPAPTTTPTATASPSATAVPIATVSPMPTPTPTATPASTRAKLLPMPKRVTLTRAGTLSIGVTCDGIGPCRDTLILRAGKSTLAKATFTLRRRGTIKLKLSKTAVRKIARTGTKVTLELKDARVVVRGTLKRH